MIAVARMIAMMTGISGHHLKLYIKHKSACVILFRQNRHVDSLCRIITPDHSIVVEWNTSERKRKANKNGHDEEHIRQRCSLYFVIRPVVYNSQMVVYGK